jgi:hypothetical protein
MVYFSAVGTKVPFLPASEGGNKTCQVDSLQVALMKRVGKM